MDDLTKLNMDTRLRRLVDDDPFQPARDPGHEVAPYIEPPAKTGSEKIAEMAISPIRQTGQQVIDQLRGLHERLDRAEQMVIQVMSDMEAFTHAKMRIIDTAAKINLEVDKQLKEAMEPLASLMRDDMRPDSTDSHAIDRSR